MFRFRGCEGPQPSKSITACEVLIRPWRAPVPRRPPNPMGQRSAPRLQGTAALHANNGNRNPDPSLEGARSLGAALGDEGIDWSQQMHGSICQGFNPKTETDLNADYTDTIRYDHQCPEVLPGKVPLQNRRNRRNLWFQFRNLGLILGL